MLSKTTSKNLKNSVNKKALERDKEKTHGKIAYRLRKQLETEGEKEVMEFKRHVS